jgi:hypothetical protein
MIQIESPAVVLTCGEDGRDLVLADGKRGTRWTLDEKTLADHPYGSDFRTGSEWTRSVEAGFPRGAWERE